MSLMNQMLRDLQRRQIPQAETGLQLLIKPVFKHRWHLSWQYLLWGLPLVVLGLILAFTMGTSEEAKRSEAMVIPSPVALASTSQAAPKLPGVHLVAVRLAGGKAASRLLLEFSQSPELPVEVVFNGRQMSVLLPELLTSARELPQPDLSNDLVAGLRLQQIDHLWQLRVNFKTDVRLEKALLSADLMHGERLALDFFPLTPKVFPSPTAVKVLPVEPVSRAVKIVTVRPSAAKVVTKQQRTPTRQERVGDYYRRGLKAAQAARSREAINYWRQVLALQPEHLLARKQLILMLLKSDRSKADKLFYAGLQLHESLSLRKWYARSILPLFGAAEAARVLQQQRVSAVDDAEYLALQAGLWQQTGAYSQAEQAYRELLQGYPANGLYRFGLAISLDQQALGESALFEYRQALDGELAENLRQYARKRMVVLAAIDGETQ